MKQAKLCLSLLCVSLLLVVGCQPKGPQRYEVNGIVLVDGKPAERVVVQLHSDNAELQGDDRYPVAVTDAQGRFSIGSQSANPGAVAGTYKVTFNWLSSAGLEATDKLKGTYADEKSSQYTVQVPAESDLEFSLKSVK